MDVGARVRELRQRRGLTLAALAGEAVSVALVSKIERGLVSPSLHTLVHLAARLGVPPARLLEDGAAPVPGSGAVEAARAEFCLGDPANAVRRAGASLAHDQPPLTRARLLAVQAEALLAAGRTAEATAAVLEGSALLNADETPLHRIAAAELAWTLGLLERRRGNRAMAQHSWVRCLEMLESAPTADLWVHLLAARAQIELASLHEVDGAVETAHHFLTRAATTLAALADPSSAAHGALAAAGDTLSDSVGEPPAALAGALALAVTVAASRLAIQTARDLVRLERAAARWPAAVAPAEVSHSRHLR